MSDFSEFDELGEVKVRLKLATLDWQGIQAQKATHWLEFSASQRRDNREEETLRIAKRANTIAIFAAVLALAAAIGPAIIGVIFGKT